MENVIIHENGTCVVKHHHRLYIYLSMLLYMESMVLNRYMYFCAYSILPVYSFFHNDFVNDQMRNVSGDLQIYTRFMNCKYYYIFLNTNTFNNCDLPVTDMLYITYVPLKLTILKLKNLIQKMCLVFRKKIQLNLYNFF